MVKIMENPIKMDDLGVLVPLFLEAPTCCFQTFFETFPAFSGVMGFAPLDRHGPPAGCPTATWARGIAPSW